MVFFLFLYDGHTIVLYLNQTPGQPVKRDYAFAGSFYAFAIWIGMGVPAIGVLLRSLLSPKAKDGGEVADNKTGELHLPPWHVPIGLAVPLQMVSQTWDGPRPLGCYTTRDFGFNYLSSLKPKRHYPELFTNGDNDYVLCGIFARIEGLSAPICRSVNLSAISSTDW